MFFLFILLIVPTVSFAEECQGKLEISTSSVEYLVKTRNMLESDVIVYATNNKRLQAQLDVANATIQTLKEKAEVKPDDPKKK